MSEVAVQAEQVNEVLSDKEGKYLTFVLGSEEHGRIILNVSPRDRRPLGASGHKACKSGYHPCCGGLLPAPPHVCQGI